MISPIYFYNNTQVVRELEELTGVIMAPEEKEEFMQNYADKPKEEIFFELKKANGKIEEQAEALEDLKDANTKLAEKLIKLELALKIQQEPHALLHPHTPPHDVPVKCEPPESTTAIIKKEDIEDNSWDGDDLSLDLGCPELGNVSFGDIYHHLKGRQLTPL